MIEPFLFLFTGLIGLVTIGLMITSYKSNPFYNFFLLVIISLVSYRFLIHGSFELGIQSFIKADRGPNSILFLITVPCSYLYHKNLTLQKRTYNIKDLKHLIFIGFLFLINTNDYIHNSFVFHYGSVTNFVLIGLFILFYLVLILRLLKKHVWFKKDLPINNSHFNLVKRWTIYLFSLNALAGIGVIVSIYFESTSGTPISGKSLGMVLLVSWLFIYFKILTSPEILYGLPILNKKLLKFNKVPSEDIVDKTEIHKNWVLDVSIEKRSQDQKLQEKIKSHIIRYVQEVDKLSFSQYIFRDSKVAQAEVAKKLGVPTSHIVYLFKYHSKVSFSEYRMQSRIKDALNLIKDEDYLKVNTLESLGYVTGFSSYNPFFSAFKKITGLSPQEYLKNQNYNKPEPSKMKYEEILD